MTNIKSDLVPLWNHLPVDVRNHMTGSIVTLFQLWSYTKTRNYNFTTPHILGVSNCKGTYFIRSSLYMLGVFNYNDKVFNARKIRRQFYIIENYNLATLHILWVSNRKATCFVKRTLIPWESPIIMMEIL